MPQRRSNRELLTRGDRAYAKKKASQFGVEEVSFDREQRTDYLTGFHKRKVQRKEHAIKKAKELEKLEKQEQRKAEREQEQVRFEKDMQRFREAMKEVNKDRIGADYSSSDEEEEHKDTNMGSEEEYSDWEGLDGKPNGILKKRKEQYEDDEFGTTTVTIEAFDMNENNAVIESPVDLGLNEKVLKSSLEKAELSAKHLAMLNARQKPRVKQMKMRQKNSKGVVKGKKSRRK
ncbi:ribosomal RNA-processing protein 17 [Trichomonascus vanleenenianus]|uniref:nucleolar protein 12 n=1 Tax=Trichomonascus vanleenenianus TaxID=2268995 RepID=UPI003EC97CE6